MIFGSSKKEYEILQKENEELKALIKKHETTISSLVDSNYSEEVNTSFDFSAVDVFSIERNSEGKTIFGIKIPEANSLYRVEEWALPTTVKEHQAYLREFNRVHSINTHGSSGTSTML